MSLQDDEIFVEEVQSICPDCARLDRETCVTCEAFPDGIPVVILVGGFDHRNPYFDGEGNEIDNGLRFIPRDADEIDLANSLNIH